MARDVDVALVAATPELARWLDRVSAQLPRVLVLPLRGAEDASAALDATQVTVVLDDPVWQAANGVDAGADLASAVRLLERLEGGAVVVSRDEIAAVGDAALLAQRLGLDAPVEPPALAPRRALAPMDRAVGFAGLREQVEALEDLSGRAFRAWRFGGAEPPSTPEGTAHLCYTGRGAAVDVPADTVCLGALDARPVILGPLLDAAATLALLDVMSFPLDAMRPRDRAIPTAVAIPEDVPFDVSLTVLSEPLLRHLGPFDLVACDDDRAWQTLRETFGWPATMRASRSALTARIREDPRAAAEKPAHQTFRRAIARQVDVARRLLPAGRHLDALLVASDVGRWGVVFPLVQASVAAVELDASTLDGSREAYPEFEIAAAFTHRPESADVAVCAPPTADGADEWRDHVTAAFERLRIGGRLIVARRFLDGDGRQLPGAGMPRAFLGEIARRTARHLVLEHVQAIRHTDDDVSSAAVFAFTKLGRPQRR